MTVGAVAGGVAGGATAAGGVGAGVATGGGTGAGVASLPPANIRQPMTNTTNSAISPTTANIATDLPFGGE